MNWSSFSVSASAAASARCFDAGEISASTGAAGAAAWTGARRRFAGASAARASCARRRRGRRTGGASRSARRRSRGGEGGRGRLASRTQNPRHAREPAGGPRCSYRTRRNGEALTAGQDLYRTVHTASLRSPPRGGLPLQSPTERVTPRKSVRPVHRTWCKLNPILLTLVQSHTGRARPTTTPPNRSSSRGRRAEVTPGGKELKALR